MVVVGGGVGEQNLKNEKEFGGKGRAKERGYLLRIPTYNQNSWSEDEDDRRDSILLSLLVSNAWI